MMTTETRPARIATMPPALREALLEFGLAHAFRTQPPGEQLRHVQAIGRSETADEERERIAAVLDELAGYSFLSAVKEME